MLKKTITFLDFNGNERTEDFYFHLTKAEVMEMEMERRGGLSATIEAIVAAKDGKQIIAIFKELIIKAYGVKSIDGREFIKSKEVVNSFVRTEAYSDLFMLLATDSTEAAAFIKGITPVTPDDHKQKSIAAVPDTTK